MQKAHVENSIFSIVCGFATGKTKNVNIQGNCNKNDKFIHQQSEGRGKGREKIC